MKIILISGRAGNGKDATATLMSGILEAEGKRVLVTHYADLLKFILTKFFGWDGQKDEHGRYLLQHVGTDVIRKQNPDFWVDFIITLMKYFSDEWDYVLIPDARFPNEIERWKEEGFDVTTVRVVRPEFESALTAKQMNHPSETALNDYPFDYVITNDGTLKELRERAEMVLSYISLR